MGIQINNLKEVREKLLGYRAGFVVRATQIDAERLRLLEEGDEDPSVFELEALARIYGIDADRLADYPIQLSAGDGVEVLTRLDEFKDADDFTRARIVAAANAAKDLIALCRRDSGVADRRNEFSKERPQLNEWKTEDRPHNQGAVLARELRRRLALGIRPISSLRDLVAERFPSLTVLYTDLGNYGPAGLGFVDSLRGPAIVLNASGKNENPLVRRFSLAHELCHLLVDWNGAETIATISGYFNDSALEQEQRANSFAVRFLCPPSILQRLDLDTPADRKTLGKYGLPYSAWRLYVRNERGDELPKEPPPELTAFGTERRWAEAEEPAGLENFPLEEVPLERRTSVVQTAARLYSRGELVRDEFADALAVTPAADLERVLDFFALELPATEQTAS